MKLSWLVMQPAISNYLGTRILFRTLYGGKSNPDVRLIFMRLVNGLNCGDRCKLHVVSREILS